MLCIVCMQSACMQPIVTEVFRGRESRRQGVACSSSEWPAMSVASTIWMTVRLKNRYCSGDRCSMRSLPGLRKILNAVARCMFSFTLTSLYTRAVSFLVLIRKSLDTPAHQCNHENRISLKRRDSICEALTLDMLHRCPFIQICCTVL